MKKGDKKYLKVSIRGLFKWESKEWTVLEMALIMGMIMIFILVIIILLKEYAIDALAVALLNDIGIHIGKFYKSRSP